MTGGEGRSGGGKESDRHNLKVFFNLSSVIAPMSMYYKD